MSTIIEAPKGKFNPHPDGTFLATMCDCWLHTRPNPWKGSKSPEGKIDTRETITEIKIQRVRVVTLVAALFTQVRRVGDRAAVSVGPLGHGMADGEVVGHCCGCFSVCHLISDTKAARYPAKSRAPSTA